MIFYNICSLLQILCAQLKIDHVLSRQCSNHMLFDALNSQQMAATVLLICDMSHCDHVHCA